MDDFGTLSTNENETPLDFNSEVRDFTGLNLKYQGVYPLNSIEISTPSNFIKCIGSLIGLLLVFYVKILLFLYIAKLCLLFCMEAVLHDTNSLHILQLYWMYA